ncbi:MAG: acyl-CoA synthetase [Chloroflexota bacterium]
MHTRPSSVVDAFTISCQRYPQKLALLFEQEHYSFAQLYTLATCWATSLRGAGLREGERVALFLENSPTFIAAYLGTFMAHGIVVLVNTQYRQTELRHILRDAGVRMCVTDGARWPELQHVVQDTPLLDYVIVHSMEPLPEAQYDALTVIDDTTFVVQDPSVEETTSNPLKPTDIALIGYTSGTTGRSKGAMLTHGNLIANSIAVTSAWQWSKDDRLLLTLPLFHIHGLGVGLMGTLLTGSTIDLRRRFDAAEVYNTLLQGQVTMFFGVPTMYTRLIAEAQQRDVRPDPIRLYVSGSAPLSQQTFEAFAELCGQQILERYGMTETIMNLTNPYEGERRPGTVGMPFPGQEARIVDVQTRAPLADGETGEIQVCGPNVFQGYWRNQAATAAAFDGEWFNTGDLGWRSADGYFTISGRARELIISGGYNVYPREVEDVLLTHPDIAEAAVIGWPHPDFGEQVVAVVVPQPAMRATLDAQEVIRWCRERLAAYKKPQQVLFSSQLPRNALGKVQKHILKQHYEQEEQ